jgi:rubrerythrin
VVESVLLQAIETAMMAERSAQEFYLQAVDHAQDPQGKALLRELADFEAYHEQKLRSLAASLRAGTEFQYEPREMPTPRPEGDPPEKEPNAADLASILSLAMDAESAERARYKGLAEAATDAAAKALFQRLALEEEIHHRIVSDAFYAISNRGVWVWAE